MCRPEQKCYISLDDETEEYGYQLLSQDHEGKRTLSLKLSPKTMEVNLGSACLTGGTCHEGSKGEIGHESNCFILR